MKVYQPILTETGSLPEEMHPSDVFVTKGTAMSCMHVWGYVRETYRFRERADKDFHKPVFLNNLGNPYIPRQKRRENPYRFIHHGAKVIWADPANAEYGEYAEDHAMTEYVVDTINGRKDGSAHEDDDIILIYDPKGAYGEAEVPARELKEASSAKEARIGRYVNEADAYFISLLKFADKRVKKAETKAKIAEDRLQVIMNSLLDTDMDSYAIYKAPGGDRDKKVFIQMLSCSGDGLELARQLLNQTVYKDAMSGHCGEYPPMNDMNRLTFAIEKGFSPDKNSWTGHNGDTYFIETITEQGRLS